jgi:hypothetical protein
MSHMLRYHTEQRESEKKQPLGGHLPCSRKYDRPCRKTDVDVIMWIVSLNGLLPVFVEYERMAAQSNSGPYWSLRL